MKQLIAFSPLFNPSAKTLDFTQYPNFEVNRLYAVINITQNTPLYIAGGPGYGISSINGGVITLSCDTSTHNTSDSINIYYDTDVGFQSNNPLELGGQLQLLQESTNQILAELKVQNIILAQGLNINIDDIERLRNDVNNASNIPSVY